MFQLKFKMSLNINRSTIDKLKKIYSYNENLNSRTISKIPVEKYDTGLTVGNVIRYDTVAQKFIKSQANTSTNSEVFGIVESINEDNSLNVVTNGSITLDTSKLINTSVPNTGNNDIYFLSTAVAGYMTNFATTESDTIVKPIYYNAPHGEYTGLVRNYIGYKTKSASGEQSSFFTLNTISQDFTKALFIDTVTFKIQISNISFTGGSINLTYFNLFSFTNLPYETSEQLDINFLSNYEIVISNNGRDILIFAKTLNKIYYINIDSNNQAKLKHIIYLNIVGSPEDKIWAVDDEITSITVSSRSLTRSNDPVYDFKNSTFDVSSKISYYRRTVNNKNNKFKWRKVYENYAHGHIRTVPRPYISNFNTNGSIETMFGAFRISDLKVNGKYFTYTTKARIEDQKLYKSCLNGFNNQRYTGNAQIANLLSAAKTYLYYGSPTTIPTEQQYRHIFFTDFNQYFYYENPSLNLFPSNILTNINSYKFKCSPGVKNYEIVSKNNDGKYFFDLSCVHSSGLKYFNPIFPCRDSSITYPTSILELRKLLNGLRDFNTNFSYFQSTVPQVPTYEQDVLESKTAIATSFFITAFLYQFKRVSDGVTNNQLVIIKYPKKSYDGQSVFKYFEYSNTVGDLIPSTTGHGLVSAFRSNSPFAEVSNQYVSNTTNEAVVFPTFFGSRENPTFTGEITLTTPNINQLTFFELFTSDNYYYICTSNYIFIWEYSTSTYKILFVDNFHQSKFYFNVNGDFFIKDSIAYKYTFSSNTLTDIELSLI